MSLKIFHIVFVSCSSALAFVFGGWSMAQAGWGYSVTGALSFAFGIGMIVYGFWFWRKIETPEEERRRRRKIFRSLPALAAVGVAASFSKAAWACSVCYGEAEGPLIEAAKTGVYLLYGMVVVVQLGLGAFLIYLWRRSRQHHGDVPGWWTSS